MNIFVKFLNKIYKTNLKPLSKTVLVIIKLTSTQRWWDSSTSINQQI